MTIVTPVSILRHLPILLLVASLASPAAAEISIRLADAGQEVPLEYWTKDVPLPDGGRMFYRGPGLVFVDGKALEFGSYINQQGLLKEAKPEAGDDLLDELEGKEKKKEKQIHSDRQQDILSGFMAEVRGDFAQGEHTIEPGGLRFSVDEFGEVSSHSPMLAKAGTESLRLLCTPLHIDFVPNGQGARIQVRVSSGGKQILSEDTLQTGRGSCSLRLYLPISDQPYTVLTNFGSASFVLAKNGLHLHGDPKLPPGKIVVVEDASLAFIEVPKSAVARATPAGKESELYLFTDRNREVFLEGETVAVSVRGFQLPEGEATPSLVNDGKRLQLSPIQFPAQPTGLAAGEFELDTGLLHPGEYQLRLQCKEVQSNSLRLQITPALSETNMKLLGWYKWGSDSFETKDLQDAVRSGLNMVVQGAGHAQGGSAIGPHNSPIQDWPITRNGKGIPLDEARYPLLRNRPNFPVELLEQKLENDAGAEFLLSHGIENLPQLGGQILYFNVGSYWQNHADDRYQAVSHLGQEWRRFPNFAGMVHCVGDGPTPATSGMVWAAGPGSYDIIHGQRLEKLRQVFEYKVGKVKINDKDAAAEFERINSAMKGAIGFGVGMDAGLKVSGDDAQKLEWARWLNDLYPNCFRNQHQALAAMMPQPMVNCGWTWGTGMGSGMWNETFFGALSHPVSDDHGDYGILPFAYVTGIDLKGAGLGKRPWVTLDLLPERTFANGLKLFLQAVSRNPAGIGVLNTHGDVAGGWSKRKDDGDQMLTLMEIGRRYGDLLMSLERRDEIAVLVSFRQAAIRGQEEPRLWGAHFLATKAGYQTNFVTETELLRNPEALSKYRAVFLAQMSLKLPEKLDTALRAFQGKGGVVIEDQDSKSDLPDAIKVQCSEIRGANEVNYHAIYERFEPLAKEFLEQVRPKLKPFFEASAPHVHLMRSPDGDLEYWALFHDGILMKDEFSGGHFTQFLYRGTTAVITASTGGVLYDAWRRKRIDGQTEKADATTKLSWYADLRRLPGTLYLRADRPIHSLEVQASEKPRPGTLFRLQARLFDQQGKPFTGRVPIEVLIKTPDGKKHTTIYRTTNQDLQIKIAGNDPPGQWQWRVTDQATGLVAEGAFEVEAESVLPHLKLVKTPIFDRAAIYEALKNRAFHIVVYPGQTELKGTADSLAEQLGKLGVKAQVRTILPSMTRQYRMNWNQHTIEDEEVHQAVLGGQVVGYRVKGKNQNGTFESDFEKAFYGKYVGSGEWVYYQDVILLGRSDLPGNPLIDLVTRQARMLPRNPSPNFPAAGKGMLGYAWAPFHYGHDAVVVHGADALGLDNAVSALLEIAAAPGKPEIPWTPIFGKDDNVVHALGGRAAATPNSGVKTVRSDTRIQDSLLPTMFDRAVKQLAAHDNRLFIRQESKLSQAEPVFAEVDLKAGTSVQYRAGDGRIRGSSIENFIANHGKENWYPSGMQRTTRGTLIPLERGLSLFDEKQQIVWFYDPFPEAISYMTARYPRRCQKFTTTRNGKWVLASFYDFNAGGGYGPSYYTFNPGVVALLDAETGKEVCRAQGYCGTQLALAEDGSRFAIIDDFVPSPDIGGRVAENPHGGPVLVSFDNRGKELFHMPAEGVQGFAVSADARRVVVSYQDARRIVTLIDFDSGTTTEVGYPKTDLGIAAAPNGSFAAITHTDGLFRKVSFKGEVMMEQRLEAPGVPAVMEDGTIVVAAADGKVYFPSSGNAPIPFASDTIKDLTVKVESPPAGLLPPQQTFWAKLPKQIKVKSNDLKTPSAAPFSFKGQKQWTVRLDKTENLNVQVLAIDYLLKDPKDVLKISFSRSGRKVTYLYPGSLSARTASIPFRSKIGEPLELTLESESGASILQTTARMLSLGDHLNSAYMSPEQFATSAMVPRVMVPNVHGCQYDPRVEQMAYGFPQNWGGKLPPDIKGKPETEVKTCFDGNLYFGTALYPTSYPSGRPAWAPRGSQPTLRSAEVIMEFSKPSTVEGIGIWEHPNDLPVSSFILEYCDNGKVADDISRQMMGDWKVAVSSRDNDDYYHAHFFKPTAAKFWRYTILATPALVQRIAEIELYAPGESIFDEDDF